MAALCNPVAVIGDGPTAFWIPVASIGDGLVGFLGNPVVSIGDGEYSVLI